MWALHRCGSRLNDALTLQVQQPSLPGLKRLLPLAASVGVASVLFAVLRQRRRRLPA